MLFRRLKFCLLTALFAGNNYIGQNYKIFASETEHREINHCIDSNSTEAQDQANGVSSSNTTNNTTDYTNYSCRIGVFKRILGPIHISLNYDFLLNKPNPFEFLNLNKETFRKNSKFGIYYYNPYKYTEKRRPLSHIVDSDSGLEFSIDKELTIASIKSLKFDNIYLRSFKTQLPILSFLNYWFKSDIKSNCREVCDRVSNINDAAVDHNIIYFKGLLWNKLIPLNVLLGLDFFNEYININDEVGVQISNLIDLDKIDEKVKISRDLMKNYCLYVGFYTESGAVGFEAFIKPNKTTNDNNSNYVLNMLDWNLKINFIF